VSLPGLHQAFVIGAVASPIGAVPQIAASLTGTDRRGTWKARWGVGRMHYTVEPGLYALGDPHAQSPVLVTANYKMSFDELRSALPGRNAWILVLDTRGINVWCAAGKGTFGTTELVQRIEAGGLPRVVTHRELILPQLAAPGVAAHRVKKLTGFKVHYGPVRALDLPSFLDAAMTATPEMRRKTFTTWERTVLIPIELVGALKPAAWVFAAVFLLSGLGGARGYWENAMHGGPVALLGLLSAIVAGAVLTPLLLPWLPGRAFSVKGFVVGLLMAAALVLLRGFQLDQWPHRLEALAWLLLVPSVAAYLAMNFTGASTYTSLSGVKKEMRWALPMQIAGSIGGALLWLTARIIA
jgi:hypothetical protein